MRTQEDIIRDKRTNEAVRKGLMSGAGKLGVIARILGDRVISKHGDNHGISPVFENLYGFDQNFMADDDELEEGQLPMMEEGDRHKATASLFNGLSRGLHIEIKLDGPEIWVQWKGVTVFHEMAGELHAYCPGDWEPVVDKLAVEARSKENDYIDIAETRNIAIGQRRKEAFLEEMKRKWGL
jgi:hypothetical protein